MTAVATLDIEIQPISTNKLPIDVRSENGVHSLRVKRTFRKLLLPALRYWKRHSLLDNLDSRNINTAIPLDQAGFAPPLFILGHPRSGTTLLREILNRHDSLCIPPENGAIRAMIDTFRIHRQQPWNKVADLVLDAFLTGYEAKHWQIDIHEVKQQAYGLNEQQQSLAGIFHLLYGHYARQGNKVINRWGDKSTPGSYIYVHDLIKVFPNAYFVHIVRDGRDCVSSCVRTGFYHQSAIRAAYAWVDNIRYCREIEQTVGAERFHLVKYEELVDSPERVISRVCQFLGTTYDHKMLPSEMSQNLVSTDVRNLSHHKNVMNPISRQSVDNWREQFTGNSITAIHKIMGTELQQYGYLLQR